MMNEDVRKFGDQKIFNQNVTADRDEWQQLSQEYKVLCKKVMMLSGVNKRKKYMSGLEKIQKES